MSELHIPLKEKLKSIPEALGIRVNEEPHYQVIKKDGDFEIRQYDRQVVAKVSMQGKTFDEFREESFKILANYIFEGNEDDLSIPMTSPVVEQHGAEDKKHSLLPMRSPVFHEQNEPGGWTMSFILPREFTLKTAPIPKDSRISIEQVEPYLVACVCFSGNATLESIKEHERQLAIWLRHQPNVQSTERFMVAQYDAPFVIPFMKRNEIQVRIDNMH